MSSLEQLCRDREAFRTDPWAIDAILRAEVLTRDIWDPCAGFGDMGDAARRHGYDEIWESDIEPWHQRFPAAREVRQHDFLEPDNGLKYGSEWTCFMNPPFSKACEFVDRARSLGARKIVCFQSWAWRESKGRRAWWAANPPARIWICGMRATCWRFDIPETCRGADQCGKGKGRGLGNVRCRQCMAGTTSTHAWYVWERGHKGAEVVNDLWPDEATV